MTLKEINDWMSEYQLEDTWWAALGEQVEGPFPITNVQEKATSQAMDAVQIMHTCFEAEPQWFEFQVGVTHSPPSAIQSDEDSKKNTTIRLKIQKKSFAPRPLKK